MNTQALIKKLVSLARMCGHLALDAEKATGDRGSGVYFRGRASGYMGSARYIKEESQRESNRYIEDYEQQ